MGSLVSVANIVGDVAAAVSTQLKSYFGDTQRFRPEFMFPAATFLIGCILLLFAVVGADVPGAWWAGVPLDVQIATFALLVLLLVVFSETSRLLNLGVRRFYGGDWPSWTWWQRSLRRRYLAQLHASDVAFQTLQNVQGTLSTITAPLARAQRTLDELSGQAAGTVRYPAPAADIPAYHLILPEEWQWVEAPDGDDLVSSPADLIGHYASVPLPSGKPVTASSLRFLPFPDILTQPHEVVAVPLTGSPDNSTVEPGSLVALDAVPKADQPPPLHELILRLGLPVTLRLARSSERPHQELVAGCLVLEYTAGKPCLLAVPRDQVRSVLVHAARGDVCARPAAPPGQPAGRAVLCAREDLPAGRVIRPEQIHWRWPVVPPDHPVSREEDAVDHLYWPPTTQVQHLQPPHGPPLAADEPLVADHLRPLPDPSLVADPAGAASYAAYRLGPANLRVVARSGENPIGAGDRVAVSVDREANGRWVDIDVLGSRRWYYVYAVANGAYFLALPPSRREQLGNFAALNRRVRLSLDRSVPVLLSARDAGSFLAVNDTAAINEATFRNLGRADSEVCLDRGAVLGRYVTVGDPIPAHRPIPRDRLATPFEPAGANVTLMRPSLILPPRRAPWDLRLLLPLGTSVRAGDLVAVEATSTNDGTVISWSRAAVHSVAGQARRPEELVVRVAPGQRGEEVSPRATVTVTHSDAQVAQALRALQRRLRRLPAEGDVDDGGSTESAKAMRRKARALLQAALDLDGLVGSLAERPWSSDGSGQACRAARDQCVTLWERLQWLAEKRYTGTSLALRQDGQRANPLVRARRLTLPAEPANVRATKMGNVLAAASEYPASAYGIDTLTILPRLLAVMAPDDPPVQRLINAEASMTLLLLTSFWAAVWTLLDWLGLGLARFLRSGTLWVFPLLVGAGILLSLVTKEGATGQAISYAEALKTLFDLRRRKLLVALGLDVDTAALTPEQERPCWQALYSLYVDGNSDLLSTLKFATPPPAQPGASAAKSGAG